ncbi:MAG: sulfatase-like hydrolase/transferase, partial [Verrucomicrobiae bacterium]|nr:sulfatase-like hydrolase/transferase [Verrucomicrobiae bacterium]
SYDLETGSGPNPDPGDHGFDTWMATGNNANPSHFQPDNFVKNGKAMGQTEGYSCDLVVQEALQFLQERDMKRPFYLNLWFHEPHARVAAPPELTERHQGKKNPAYYGSIENMDQAIGRLLDKLSALNLRDNTLIVFTSDNGSYMAGSNGPLKGRKTELWEGGIRVPAIFVWPGIIPAGRLCKMPAGIV